MFNSANNRQKLFPLRRFAVHGLYSAAYLSQLVQRKKLRTKKIGRNYYTCEEWFREYLNKHARDEIRRKYKEVLEQPVKYRKLNKQAIAKSRTNPKVDLRVFIFDKIFSYRTATIVLAVFVILFLANEYKPGPADSDGRVAGVEEMRTASSTELQE